MQEFIKKLSESKKIIKINELFIEIITDAEIKKGVNIRIFLKKIDDKIFLSDNQHTLRYMNTLYELRANDVKACINAVVKNYNFKIEKGEILSEVKLFDDINKRYNDLLICCATLANMFLFFDEPN